MQTNPVTEEDQLLSCENEGTWQGAGSRDCKRA